jgi:hypothetical protein
MRLKQLVSHVERGSISLLSAIRAVRPSLGAIAQARIGSVGLFPRGAQVGISGEGFGVSSATCSVEVGGGVFGEIGVGFFAMSESYGSRPGRVRMADAASPRGRAIPKVTPEPLHWIRTAPCWWQPLPSDARRIIKSSGLRKP